MSLPKCCRCGKQPCECKETTITLRRLILDMFREHRRMNDEHITDEIERLYNQVQESVPWLLIDGAVWGLVCGRRIKRTKGKWEGEYWYSLKTCSANRLRQEVLF